MFKRSRVGRSTCSVVMLMGLWLGMAAVSHARIVSGTIWTDSSGNVIEAHGGGIIQVDGTYYWIGENKTNGATFYANSCYRSTDLAHWTFVNDVLSLQSSGDLGPNRIVERPKVIYNSSTQTYVMYMHIDDTSYSDARVGVATSSTVCGKYNYLGSFRPLGYQSRDIGLFQDTDGSAYLLSEDRQNGLRVDALSSDYLSVTSAVALLPDMEAPAMVKVGSTYFIFSSHLSGWSPNNNQYATATSLAGPWSTLTDFAPSGTNTFSSQTTFVLPVSGSSGTTIVYMGDRWVPNDLATSSYIWLPMRISGSSASLPAFYNAWNLNVAAGTWSLSSGLKTGVPLQIISDNSGLCLDVYGASTSQGAQIDQWTCTGASNQNWTLTSLGGNNYSLTAQNSGMVLDDPNWSVSQGTILDQWPWNRGANQQWIATSIGNGYFTLKNAHSGFCVDVLSASKSPGAYVDQWPCNNGTNQAWLLVY